MARPWHEAPDDDVAHLARTGVPGYDPWRDAGACKFRPGNARAAFLFFHKHLRLIEGETAGQPFALQDWQAAIVANLFGWVAPDGFRRYREVFILIARKNGKTPLAAAIALYLLFCDDEPGAQVYCAAAELQQAALVYRHAAGMVAADPTLTSMCRLYKASKSIEFPSTTSIFRALSADADTKHGLNVHGAIVDEVHVHPNANLIKTLTSATSSRRQPMVVYITTADYERTSACNELHDYARKVRDGTVKAAKFLPVLYEASTSDDWTLESTWRKANPNLGVSKKLDYLVEGCEKAKAIPSYRNEFLRLDLNIRTGLHSIVIDPPRWDECAGALAYPALARSLVGQPCFGGLDLATKHDLIAFALFFPLQYAVLAWHWCPADNAQERALRDRAPYLEWALRTREGDATPGVASILPWESDGFLRLTDGNVADYAVVEADFMRICETFKPKTVNYDDWNAEATVQRLIARGVDMAPMRQGLKSLSPPTKELVERLVPARMLRHGGHPILRWMVTHVQAERDAAGNMKFTKERSRERIDGLVALTMAIGASIVSPVEAPPVAPQVFFVGRDGSSSEDEPEPDPIAPWLER